MRTHMDSWLREVVWRHSCTGALSASVKKSEQSTVPAPTIFVPQVTSSLLRACGCDATCRHASGELVQLSLVSLCLCSAWLCGRLGLSEELGAFMAGRTACAWLFGWLMASLNQTPSQHKGQSCHWKSKMCGNTTC